MAVPWALTRRLHRCIKERRGAGELLRLPEPTYEWARFGNIEGQRSGAMRRSQGLQGRGVAGVADDDPGGVAGRCEKRVARFCNLG